MPTRMTFVGADDAGPSGGADEDNSGNAGESEPEQPRQFVAGPPQAQASQAGGAQPQRPGLVAPSAAQAAPSPAQLAAAQQAAAAQAQAAAMRSDPAYIHGAALRASRSNARNPEDVYDDRIGQMVGMYRQIHDVGTWATAAAAAAASDANASAGGGSSAGNGIETSDDNNNEAAAAGGRTKVPWQNERGGRHEQHEQPAAAAKVKKLKPKTVPMLPPQPPKSYGGRNVAAIVVGRQLTPGGGRGRQSAAALQALRDRTNDGSSPSSLDDADSHSDSSPPRKKLVASATSTTIATEIRRFGEHCSATKFHWSYLSSTGDALTRSSHHTSQMAAQAHVRSLSANDDDDSVSASAASASPSAASASLIPPSYQPNRTGVTDILTAHTAPARPAVSTISLSFAPDGRTLASTHGDHTVKITCCETGRLVRNLEGHPRTPWTVKYHPVDSNIVASGCLGFQVRVWDWNYRPYNSRKHGSGRGGGGGMAARRTTIGKAARRPPSPRAVVGGLEGGTGGSGNGAATIDHDPLPRTTPTPIPPGTTTTSAAASAWP